MSELQKLSSEFRFSGPVMGPAAGGFISQTIGVKYIFVVLAGTSQFDIVRLDLIRVLQVLVVWPRLLVFPFCGRPMRLSYRLESLRNARRTRRKQLNSKNCCSQRKTKCTTSGITLFGPLYY